MNKIKNTRWSRRRKPLSHRNRASALRQSTASPHRQRLLLEPVEKPVFPGLHQSHSMRLVTGAIGAGVVLAGLAFEFPVKADVCSELGIVRDYKSIEITSGVLECSIIDASIGISGTGEKYFKNYATSTSLINSSIYMEGAGTVSNALVPELLSVSFSAAFNKGGFGAGGVGTAAGLLFNYAISTDSPKFVNGSPLNALYEFLLLYWFWQSTPQQRPYV